MSPTASTAATPAAKAPRRTSWQVQRSVIFAIVLREMASRVGGQWVGAIWTLFEPMAHTLLIIVWLGLLRTNLMPGIEYPVFLVTGLIPFFFFQKLATRLLDGIDANRGLLAYRQVKPLDTMIGRAVVEALMNLIVYVVTLLFLAWLGFHIIPGLPLEMIGINLLIGWFGFAFGLMGAVLSHDSPRLRTFIRMLFFPLYLASGVILSIDHLPREYIDWLLWNPLLHLVELSRHSFLPQYVPVEGINALYPVQWALWCSALGLGLYQLNRRRLLVTS